MSVIIIVSRFSMMILNDTEDQKHLYKLSYYLYYYFSIANGNESTIS